MQEASLIPIILVCSAKDNTVSGDTLIPVLPGILYKITGTGQASAIALK